MIIIFFTGYVVPEEQEVVLNHKDIAKNYLRTYFFFDLIPNLPYGLFYDLYSKQHWYSNFYFCITFVELLKMVRFKTVVIYIKELSDYFKIQVRSWYTVIASIMMYVLSIIVTGGFQVLWHSHIYYFPDSLYNQRLYDEYTWVLKNKTFQQTFVGDISAPRFLSLYLTQLTLSLGVLPHIQVVLWFQKISWIITLIICGGAHILLLIVMLTYFLTKSDTEVKFHCLMNQVEAYMESKNLPETLQQKIKIYYKYKYRNQYFRDEYIKTMLNSNLKKEIDRHICKTWMENFPMIANMPTYRLNQLMTRFEHKIYMHGEIIFEYGTVPEYAYFINNGTVALYTKSGIEFRHVQDGGFFGGLAYFFGISKLNIVTAISLELTEMYCLPIKYLDALYSTETAQTEFKNALLERIAMINKTEQQYSEKLLKSKLAS